MAGRIRGKVLRYVCSVRTQNVSNTWILCAHHHLEITRYSLDHIAVKEKIEKVVAFVTSTRDEQI